MNRKTTLVALAILLLGGAGLAAQSNDQLDRILASPRVTASQAAWIIATSAGLVPETASESEAVAVAGAWAGFDPSADSVRVDRYALWLSKAFAYKGGVMYSLAPSPRYALREMQHIRVIIGLPRPDKLISGEEALRYAGNYLSWKE